MTKEYNMFDDLFTPDDFSLEDEKQEEVEEELEELELDTTDPDDEDLRGPFDDDPCDDCDPDVSCDCDSDDPNCNKAGWDTGIKKWDTGTGQRPVPKNVWKPKGWKTY